MIISFNFYKSHFINTLIG
ncbi:Protein of unknown function [Bacillus wiedmannii]|nr:Protein of unknown function [Bacillus wiedmannii]